MVEYGKVNVKWTGSELKKLKPAVKNNTGATLRISLKCLMEMIKNKEKQDKKQS